MLQLFGCLESRVNKKKMILLSKADNTKLGGVLILSVYLTVN